mmetsp:Transcript_45136/g.128910  ORF Transcript_45136/g.128910 Transcript_45136/m.128910 type:complete len:223 (-) Transcript_45136:157-825(-)
MQGSARLRHPRGWVPELGKTEVDQLEVVAVCLMVHKIFQLQVPMGNLVGVQVGHGKQHLVCGPSCVLLGVTKPCSESLIKLAALHELHHQMNFVSLLKHHLKPCYMRVVQRQVQLCLITQLAPELGGQPALLEALDRILPAVVFASCQHDRAVQSAAQHPACHAVVLLQVPGVRVAPGNGYRSPPGDHLVYVNYQVARGGRGAGRLAGPALPAPAHAEGPVG